MSSISHRYFFGLTYIYSKHKKILQLAAATCLYASTLKNISH